MGRFLLCADIRRDDVRTTPQSGKFLGQALRSDPDPKQTQAFCRKKTSFPYWWTWQDWWFWQGHPKIRVLTIHLLRGDGGVERIPTTVAKITLADVEVGVIVRHP